MRQNRWRVQAPSTTGKEASLHYAASAVQAFVSLTSGTTPPTPAPSPSTTSSGVAPAATVPDVATTLNLANVALQISAVLIAALTLVLAILAILGARSLSEVRQLKQDMDSEVQAMADSRRAVRAELSKMQDEFETLVLVAHLYNQGQTAYGDSDYERALAFYQEALELQPDNNKVRVRLARTYINQGLTFPAESLLRNISSTAPANADAWRALATVYRYRDRSHAIECMEKSLELDRSSDESWNYLGLLLRDDSKFGDAVAAHQQALRVTPASPIAHFYVGLLEARLGSPHSNASLDQAHTRVESLRKIGRIKTIWADTIDWAYFVSVADQSSAKTVAEHLGRSTTSSRNRQAILQHMVFYLASRGEVDQNDFLGFFPAGEVEDVKRAQGVGSKLQGAQSGS